MENLAGLIVTTYLLLGILFLVVFDIITHRLRDRLTQVTYDAQVATANSGSYVRHGAMKIIVVVIMWVFWVGVLVNALLPDKKER